MRFIYLAHARFRARLAYIYANIYMYIYIPKQRKTAKNTGYTIPFSNNRYFSDDSYTNIHIQVSSIAYSISVITLK